MKYSFRVLLPALLLLSLAACEKSENTEPAPPPPTNRIDYLLVDEAKEELLIYGKFPDDKGSVQLGNDVLAVKQWSPVLIICSVPYTEVLGFGDVVVRSSNTQSTRRLYKWVIEFSSERPHGGLTSDIFEEAHGEVEIRGDIRPAPANVFTDACRELYYPGIVYYSAQGSANSSYDCGTVLAEWTITTDVLAKSPGIYDLSAKTHFQGYKDILSNGFDLYLDFLEWETIPMKVTIDPCNAPATFSEKKWSSQVIGLDRYDPIPLRFAPGSHNLESDSITQEVYNSTQLIWNAESSEAYKRTATLRWKCTVKPE